MVCSPLLRALGALTTVAACAPSEIELHPVEFPGFSLRVPRSVNYRPSGAPEEYRAGSAKSESAFLAVNLTWQTAAITAEAEAATFIESARRLLPAGATLTPGAVRTLTVGMQPALQIDAEISLDGETAQVSYIDIACGARSILIEIVSARLHPLRARILDSFDCHPIAAQEQAIRGSVPIGFDSPALLAGWTRDPDPDPFTLQNGTRVLVAVQTARFDSDVASSLGQLFGPIFRQQGWKLTRTDRRFIGGATRLVHHGRITEGDATMNAVITAWNCPGRSDGVMVMVANAKGADLAILDQLRCAQASDPPLNLPPTPTPVDEASGASD